MNTNNLSKISFSILLITALFAFPLSSDCSAKEITKVIRWGTSSVGSSGYNLSAGMSNIVNKYTNYEASVIPVGGTAATIRAITRKDRDFGLGNSYDIYTGYTGTGKFSKEGKQPIRLVARCYTSQMTFMAQPGIETVQDFKGKIIMYRRKPVPIWGLYGDAVLKAYGISQKDVKVVSSIKTKELIDALKVGSVHAGLIPGGAPNAYTIQLLTLKKYNFIRIDEEKLAAIDKEFPFMVRATIPAGTYKGQDKEVHTMGYVNALFVSADLPDEVVYNVTKTIFTHHDEFAKVHPLAKKVTLENACKDPVIPIHPGAKKYYEEAGVLDK